MENQGLKVKQILPMKLDAFYVSLLSEKNSANGKLSPAISPSRCPSLESSQTSPLKKKQTIRALSISSKNEKKAASYRHLHTLIHGAARRSQIPMADLKTYDHQSSRVPSLLTNKPISKAKP